MIEAKNDPLSETMTGDEITTQQMEDIDQGGCVDDENSEKR